jgi:hypothetical protein
LKRGVGRGRRAVLPEHHRGRLEAAHTAGADQQIGLKAELRHADQMQILGATPNQGPNDGKGAARIAWLERDAGAISHLHRQVLDRGSHR